MRSAIWDVKIENYWFNNADEEAYLGYVYHRDPHPVATYIPYVWGSELEDNRTFSFFVSDSSDLAQKDFKPRFVSGEELGEEWDEALARFWRERDLVEEMKRVEKRMAEMGIAPLPWLEEQKNTTPGLYPDVDQGEEDEEDVDDYEDDVSLNGRARGFRKRRKDSGSSN